jgi:cytochrome c-type biogenesis protein CcmF
MLLGKSLMWASFVASLLALAGFILVQRNRTGWLKPARAAHVLMTACLVAAAALLMNLILTHQFQFSYVYRYSSRDLPLHFLASTFWAGQEGTFLLWAMYTSILGLIVMRSARHFEAGVMTFVLVLQSFLLLILVKLSPFAIYPVAPPDGAGLNPLLQDYWMVIHPPLLFVGFAAFTIPAAFAMNAMVRKDTDEWVKGALPWTAFAVLVLGTAICLGGYWAYRTLGWGGYWGWDPVENSSLVPWLFGVALLHGLVVQTHRGTMKRLNLFLAVSAFMLILYSTFLTRSGVLGDFSVHSFVDLGINGYLIAFVASYALLGFGLYIWRVKGMKDPGFTNPALTREYGMFLGALSVLLFALLVLAGTSAPLITRIAGEPANVSMAFYKVVSIPFGILIMSLLCVAPNLLWNSARKSPLRKALLPPVILGGLTTVLLFLLGVRDPQYVLLAFAAACAVFVNLEIVIATMRKNAARAGGYLVHVALGLMLIGIVTSTIYDRSESVVLPKGQMVQALGYRMTWKGERPADGGTHLAYDIDVVDANGKSFTASPVMFYSAYTNGVMRRPAIKRFARADLYFSPQGIDREESMDRMDKRELRLNVGETAMVDSTIIFFEGFEPRSMTGERIEIAALLRVTANGRTETIRPVLAATGEGQQYQEALVTADGTKIIMRRIDPDNPGPTTFYVRQPGSVHYHMPIEALFLDLSIKPFIMILWVGTFIGIAGLIMTVVYRARAAAIAWRKSVMLREMAPAPPDRTAPEPREPEGAEGAAATG